LGAIVLGVGASAIVLAQDDLLAGIPEPAAANFQAQDAIQEGGQHFFYTTSAPPGNVVNNYQSALSAAGWTIVNSGGDPFGMFGAGLTATNGVRYLKMKAGGPGGSTFIDICVWPSQPGNDNCGQNNNQQSSGNGVLGASGNLLSGVPDLTNAEFKAEDPIHEGGRHFFYTSSAAPGDVVGAYESALQSAGWNILNSGGGGDPFGMFGGGANLTATDGTRYIKLNAGGPTGSTFIDACIWPTRPSDDDCQNNNQNSNGAGLLGSGGLMAGIPEPANATFQAEDTIQQGGRHFFYTSSTAPGEFVSDYQAALESAGWTIQDSGGDPFGAFGAGLTATNDTRYLKLNAGGPPGSTFIDACVWPSPPANDNCGQNNNNQTTTGNAALGSGGSLMAGVPEPAGAAFQAEDAIQEGGRHRFHTSSDSPGSIVSAYEAALKSAGWNVVSSGGGGDPFGLFGGGAGLTATNGSRYLKFNAGGPAGSTFIDTCVWPAKPGNDNCGQNNNNNQASLGAGGDLLAGVPEPANAAFQSENAIQEGGRHFFYTSSAGPGDVVGAYENALQAVGWDIKSSGGGGDPFGLFGGGAGLTATDGSRYLTFNAGGPPGSTFIDACIWPSQPSDNNCGQNNNQASVDTAVMGAGGGLMAGIPELTNADFQAEDAIQEGGRHFYFTSSASPSTIVGSYQDALTAVGWNIVSSGGGGDPFGMFGGGAGLTATDGARYLTLNAGGPPGSTFIDGCMWPSKPVDDNCGQNNNNNNDNDNN
jgi:predicted RNA-binding protein with PUA-like domain